MTRGTQQWQEEPLNPHKILDIGRNIFCQSCGPFNHTTLIILQLCPPPPYICCYSRIHFFQPLLRHVCAIFTLRLFCHLNGRWVTNVQGGFYGPEGYARVLGKNSRQSQSLGGQLAKRKEKTLCHEPMTSEWVLGEVFFLSPFSLSLSLSHCLCSSFTL